MLSKNVHKYGIHKLQCIEHFYTDMCNNNIVSRRNVVCKSCCLPKSAFLRKKLCQRRPTISKKRVLLNSTSNGRYFNTEYIFIGD